MQNINAIYITTLCKAKSVLKANFVKKIKTSGGVLWVVNHEQAN